MVGATAYTTPMTGYGSAVVSVRRSRKRRSSDIQSMITDFPDMLSRCNIQQVIRFNINATSYFNIRCCLNRSHTSKKEEELKVPYIKCRFKCGESRKRHFKTNKRGRDFKELRTRSWLIIIHCKGAHMALVIGSHWAIRLCKPVQRKQ